MLFRSDNFNEVAEYFKELINIGRQLNYSETGSDRFNNYYNQLKEMISKKTEKQPVEN